MPCFQPPPASVAWLPLPRLGSSRLLTGLTPSWATAPPPAVPHPKAAEVSGRGDKEESMQERGEDAGGRKDGGLAQAAGEAFQQTCLGSACKLRRAEQEDRKHGDDTLLANCCTELSSSQAMRNDWLEGMSSKLHRLDMIINMDFLIKSVKLEDTSSKIKKEELYITLLLCPPTTTI
uniref:Uncharacterized protein n=1 Tax=Sphaerodactylus townsendi TaxID=933632 RepID=A0ACB8G4F9_9SAUR